MTFCAPLALGRHVLSVVHHSKIKRFSIINKRLATLIKTTRNKAEPTKNIYLRDICHHFVYIKCILSYLAPIGYTEFLAISYKMRKKNKFGKGRQKGRGKGARLA